MSDIIPYISSEPPPLVTNETATEDVIYTSNDISNSKSISLKEIITNNGKSENISVLQHISDTDLQEKPTLMSGVELTKHLDKVVSEIGENYDEIDGVNHGAVNPVDDDDDDLNSQISEEGQFEDQLNEMFDEKGDEIMKQSNQMDAVECHKVIEGNNPPIPREMDVIDDYGMDYTDFSKISPSMEVINIHDGLESKKEDDECLNVDQKPDESLDKSSDSEFADFAAFPVHFIDELPQNDKSNIEVELNNEDDIDFADFSAFPVQESNKSEQISTVTENDEIVLNHTIHNNEDVDDDVDFDDFDDFATFQSPVEPISEHKAPVLNEKELLEKMKIELLQRVTEIPGELFCKLETPNCSLEEPNHFCDNNYEVWKELINFDYSPAFQFQWLQSTVYEKFVDSLGPQYRQLINSQRAALPLFSSNMNPLEPIPASEITNNNTSSSNKLSKKHSLTPTPTSILSSHSPQSHHHIKPTTTSAGSTSVTNPDSLSIGSGSTSSQLDLHSNMNNMATLGQFDTLSIKNLEDEFIFSSTSPQVNSTPTASMIQPPSFDDTMTISPSTQMPSSTQEPITERIFRNLKLVTGQSSSSSVSPVIRPQTKTVLSRLPDLSYMNSTVLMFPILSATSHDTSRDKADGNMAQLSSGGGGGVDLFPGNFNA